MAKTDDQIIVHMVDPVAVGYRFERRRMRWPLHITLASWFTAMDEAALDAGLRMAVGTTEPFEYSVGNVEQFGSKHDVPVNIIDEPAAMTNLQQSILQGLQQNARFVSTNFQGESFRPHITRHEPDGHYAQAGDRLVCADVHLVRLLAGNICEVRNKYALGKAQSHGE